MAPRGSANTGMGGSDDGLVRRVEALLDLLNVAGVDTVDNSILDREVQRFNAEIKRVAGILPEEPQAWDKQVDRLVRQLRESLRDTPERDALEQETKHLEESYSRSISGVSPRRSPPPQPQPQPPQPAPSQQEEEDRRQYLEREFSSTSYPKIGPGYSDTISVVSELTIPTVVPGAVPPEEDYGPPIVIDFSSNKSDAKKDRRTATNQLRPPSRRVVTRSGGAAAQRRQSYQATMAHLEASGTINNSNPKHHQQIQQPPQHAIPASSVQMTVNDFPSLNESSNFFEETAKPKRRENGRRSLLRKSNKYAAAVETASSRMLLRQNSVKSNPKSTKYSRRAQQQQQPARQNSSIDLDGIMGSMGKDIGFIFQELNALDADNGGESKVRNTLGSVAKSLGGDLDWPKQQQQMQPQSQQSDPVLIDEDGFLIGGKKDDTPETAFADFDAAPKDAFDNSFFNPAPAPSRRKKGSSRRASLTSADVKPKLASPRRATMDMMGSSPKASRRSSIGNKESRIDAVEYATKQRLDMLRQMAADNGESAAGLDSKIDFVEAETMKQIRRLRDRLGEND